VSSIIGIQIYPYVNSKSDKNYTGKKDEKCYILNMDF
jgi:hypothetical protein